MSIKQQQILSFIIDNRQMEADVIAPEELGVYFKSKKDLYLMLSIDCEPSVDLITIGNYFYPKYHRCGLEFLRQVLAGEKKVSTMTNQII